MKKALLVLMFICLAVSQNFAQNKKAEKEAAAQALFEKAKATIESKDFVIVPDTYESSTGSIESNVDEANFLAYEGGVNLFLQGSIICGNSYTNKTTVSSFEPKTDKKGNYYLSMQVTGTAIQAKIEISLKKGSNYAEVILTPSKGTIKIFSGEIVPRAQAKYFKRPNVV